MLAPPHMSLLDDARTTLAQISNAALATVCPDGRPWNSPVFIAFDGYAFYWASLLDSVHSRNIAVNPDVFLVVFDSIRDDATGHGVYVRAQARELRDASSVTAALQALARRRQEATRPAADFMAPHRHRVYEAVPEAFWTNVVRSIEGHTCDERVPVDLLSLGWTL